MSKNALTIRPEAPEDFLAITSVVNKAFFGMPYAEGDEAELVLELRSRNALIVSLVAEQDGEIVGQIAFSPAFTQGTPEKWFGLGPISVLPNYQGRGIGSALLRAGLTELKKLNAGGCILVGNQNICLNSGFVNAPECSPVDEPSEFFMLKHFHGIAPTGVITFHDAFVHK